MYIYIYGMCVHMCVYIYIYIYIGLRQGATRHQPQSINM